LISIIYETAYKDEEIDAKKVTDLLMLGMVPR